MSDAIHDAEARCPKAQRADCSTQPVNRIKQPVNRIKRSLCYRAMLVRPGALLQAAVARHLVGHENLGETRNRLAAML